MKAVTPPRLLDTDQTVQKFHELGMVDVSKRTIERWCSNGTLNYVLVANRRRFREDRLDALITRWVKESA